MRPYLLRYVCYCGRGATLLPSEPGISLAVDPAHPKCQHSRHHVTVLLPEIVNYFGGPHLFIDIECPNALMLMHNRTMNERPRMTSNVFWMLMRLIDALVREGLFDYITIITENPLELYVEGNKGRLRAVNKRALHLLFSQKIQPFPKREATSRAKFLNPIDVLLGWHLVRKLPDPRVILAMCRRGNLEWARTIPMVERRFYDLGGGGKPSSTPLAHRSNKRVSPFCKGLCSKATAALIRDTWDAILSATGSVMAAMVDQSRADAHQRDIHLAKFYLYSKMLDRKARVKLVSMLKGYMQPKFTGFGGFRMKMSKGQLMTGVMDTALANNVNSWLMFSLFRKCITNITLNDEFQAETGMRLPHVRMHEYDFTVFYNGDDCVPMCSKPVWEVVSPYITPFFEKMGCVMRIEGVAMKFEHIDFCQTRPVEFGRGWSHGEGKMVRNVAKVIQTTLVNPRHTRLTDHDWGLRLWVVGMCEGILNLGVPVLFAFAECLCRNGIEPRKMSETLLELHKQGYAYRALIELASKEARQLYGFNRNNMRRVTPAPITQIARHSFAEAFGIPPEEQVRLEEYFSTAVIDRPESGCKVVDPWNDMFREGPDPPLKISTDGVNELVVNIDEFASRILGA